MLNIDQLKYDFEKPFHTLIKKLKIFYVNKQINQIYWYNMNDWFFYFINEHLIVNKRIINLMFETNEEYICFMFKKYYNFKDIIFSAAEIDSFDIKFNKLNIIKIKVAEKNTPQTENLYKTWRFNQYKICF